MTPRGRDSNPGPIPVFVGYNIIMNNNKRTAFHMILDGKDALTTVYGWKNLRAYQARMEAKGRVVSYYL